jgi:hypothetical protein
LPKNVLFVFLDGVGLEPPGPGNPLAAEAWSGFRALAGGSDWTSEAPVLTEADHVFRPIDARLGVEGLPQSGTGQATLFTGTNCAERAGRHFGPFPHSTAKPLLAAESIFHKVQAQLGERDEPCAFANAYPPRFFAHVEKRGRWTVTTRAARGADVRLRRRADLDAGDALAADLTAEAWRDHLDLDVPPRSPAQAGRQLLRLGRGHAFTLFEYYLTDKAGHGRGARTPQGVLADLDAFFGALLAGFRPTEELLLVTSDHGNVEDPSRKTHTLAPVPLVAYGRGARAFAGVQDLTGVVPATLEALGAPPAGASERVASTG